MILKYNAEGGGGVAGLLISRATANTLCPYLSFKRRRLLALDSGRRIDGQDEVWEVQKEMDNFL